ncbi:reversion-inducing cysteine-rich protein with Kazal motifs [Lethenteron reissneri]|uniref:reversion-inducing cysteine-rich protein with Kazal motifs n=1 Tax=Lethenteron reissneri TaxID=7753 RepID=UPI002AB64D89|nr:reversion-inducing cysteine-rich protein with Kazal motifs [Lethenteron reissneri]
MGAYPGMIAVFLLVYSRIAAVRCQDAACCYQAREYPICREACEQLTSTKSDSRLRHLLHRLPGYCPDSMIGFWDCINSTLPGVQRKPEGWVGLGCCELAIANECRRACRQASAKSGISSQCRKEYETALYNCVNRNEMGSLCCSHAGRHTNCREYCQAIFRTDSAPTPNQIRTVENYCSVASPAVVRCFDNYTQSYPARNPLDSLHCCERAADSKCEAACRRVLVTIASEQEMVEGLIEGCGRQPLPQDPLWQCFLEGADTGGGRRRAGGGGGAQDAASSPTGLDGAKLQCCSRANSPHCRDLCVGLFSMSWGSAQSWQEFERECEYRLQEPSMMGCLADVREPCQLGCRDLNYCTNFNNRPTELFRGCNAQADQGALNDIRLWERGTIQMPFLIIPVKDIRRCQPETWKAIACVLQIKPCLGSSPVAIICRSDCVDILEQCGDMDRFPAGHSADTICDILSPTDEPEQCIPLSRYLTPGSINNGGGGSSGGGGKGWGPGGSDSGGVLSGVSSEEVVHPCNPNPCPTSHLCEVNRKGCTPGQDCLPYLCVPGCKLGEASDFLVRKDSMVRVPVASGEVGCYRLCSCGTSGRLEDCAETPCLDTRSCIVGGQRKSHGTHFRVDCNVCSCFAGELSCSVRQCLSGESSEEDRRRFTGLPCNCADQFVPVCAINGRTYPNACIARCTGLQDSEIEYGTCATRDPCSPSPCPSGQRCVPTRRVCLSSLEQFSCEQFECLSRQPACEGQPQEPACDTTNTEHPSLCALYVRGRSLAYTGPCQSMCGPPSRLVCGHDGESYASVCTAYSERVAVDYAGPCQAVGLLSHHVASPECDAVTCPALPVASCKPITPPGACCPICAGMMRILWSKEQVDILARTANRGPITVSDIVHGLRLHVSVPQCDVFGYLSIETDIIILVLPVDLKPTALQIEACSKEAEKIGVLINSGSPVLVSHVPLSALTNAQVYVSTGGVSGVSPPPTGPSFVLLLGVLMVTCHRVLCS